MEATGPLAEVARRLVTFLVQAGSAILMVVLGWTFIKYMISGGDQRSMTGLALRLVSIGIAVAALSNLTMTAGIIVGIGGAILTAVAQSIQGAL